MAFSVGVLRWRSDLIAFQAEDRDFVNPFWYLPRSERRSVPAMPNTSMYIGWDDDDT